MVTRQIHVSGRVQGVGFRAGLQATATEVGVSGWVRNRSDGTLEALLHGPADAVDAVISWARRGPPASRVSEVRVMPADAPPEQTRGFQLLPTA